MCDSILASPSAIFGQPEINHGIIPAARGTHCLTRADGKARAMELVLTGRTFSSSEAEKWGVVNRVVENVVMRRSRWSRRLRERVGYLSLREREWSMLVSY